MVFDSERGCLCDETAPFILLLFLQQKTNLCGAQIHSVHPHPYPVAQPDDLSRPLADQAILGLVKLIVFSSATYAPQAVTPDTTPSKHSPMCPDM